MKETTKKNIPIAMELPFEFAPKEYSLKGWGTVDFFCEQDGVLVFLEIEEGQLHPNSNVLKDWPFLEENPDRKILLIQVFRGSKKKASPNRVKLCSFTGRKLEELFPKRFRYYTYDWESGTQDHTNKILKKFSELKNT